MVKVGFSSMLLIVLPITLMFLFAGISFSQETPEDILVVVNKGVALDAIQTDDLRNIFLLKKKLYDTAGKKLTPINASEGTDLREAWREAVLGMSKGKEKMYWKKAQMKSGLRPPKGFSNPLQVVFQIKNSVGYVKRADYKEGVAKIVAVIKQ